MNIKLREQLKNAGFPQLNKNFCEEKDHDNCAINQLEKQKPDYEPTAEELIKEIMKTDSLFLNLYKEGLYYASNGMHSQSIHIEGEDIKTILAELYLKIKI